MSDENNQKTEKEPVKSEVAKREEEILKFWKENKIFEKTLENKSKEFVFYDGPPFATGLPHYGHLLAGTMKDVIPRFKTMQGFHVPRQWGWDCHGLPIENIIEKELGLKTKKEIEEYGIEKFNEKARGEVMKFASDWKEIIPRMGRWVDMENDYKTMDTSYTESVWSAFKNLYDKKLIYEGFKSMHLCPRCETTLSNFEVNQGYKEITDLSVTVKFKLKSPEKLGLKGDVFVLAWTTTPWTLPGNIALAVKLDIDYVKIKFEISGLSEKSSLNNVHPCTYILSKQLFKKGLTEGRDEKSFDPTGKLNSIIKMIFGMDHLEASLLLVKNEEEFFIKYRDRVQKVIGKDLEGLEYEPIFDYYNNEKTKNLRNGFKIYGADFVTTEDGTGIVHIAPAFGEDDMELGKKNNLPFIQHVSTDGKMKPDVKDFAGLSVKPKGNPRETDEKVVEFLEKKGGVFAKENFKHAYPFCWRCETPLLNYASSSWFVKVTDIKDKLISENKKIGWVPEDIKEGRFGKWLEGARDWAISRTRFWGAPLPVWKCGKCEKVEILGSIEDIKKKSQKPANKYFIMRHGEAENNTSGIINSDSKKEIHLTEKGITQVLESAKKLSKEKIDVVIASPFFRTKETAEKTAEVLGISPEKIIFDPRIGEINAGEFDGKGLDEFHAYFKTFEERFERATPGGENFNDIRKRVGEFLYEIDKKYSGKNILIVTHELISWIFFMVGEGWGDREAVERWQGEKKEPFMKNAEVKGLSFSPLPHNKNYSIDLHRPYIDEIEFVCECARSTGSISSLQAGGGQGGKMRRIPDVFDCWFESGSMPYAKAHYPFLSLDKFNPESGLLKKSVGYPADFIAEGLDQTRGWFYTMLVLSTALFGKASYKNVIVNGIILAEDGQKMSKRLKNYPDPMEVVNKYGADALRYYLMSSPAVHAEDIRFSEKGVDEVYKKNILRLLNVFSFYSLYSSSLVASGLSRAELRGYSLVASSNVLDLWVLARLNELIKEVTDSLEKYELDKAARPIADFIDDLSVWYLRRSRERFKSDNEEDKKSALKTTRFVLLELAKVMAPFTPFIAEDIYKKVGGEKESVHLETWPASADTLRRAKPALLEEMAEVRKIVSLGLEARAKAGIKVRQPLALLKIRSTKSEILNKKELHELIKDEVNVKEIIFDEKISGEVELDTKITPELQEEGNVRDFIRSVQELRKEEKLLPSDKVELLVETSPEAQKFLEKNKEEIVKITSLSQISFGPISSGKEIKIGDFSLKIQLKK